MLLLFMYLLYATTILSFPVYRDLSGCAFSYLKPIEFCKFSFSVKRKNQNFNFSATQIVA